MSSLLGVKSLQDERNKQVDPNSAYEKGLKEPNNPSEMEERMIDRADNGAYRSTLSKIKNILGL